MYAYEIFKKTLQKNFAKHTLSSKDTLRFTSHVGVRTSDFNIYYFMLKAGVHAQSTKLK